MDIYLCITESLCCTAEINTTLKINSTSVKQINKQTASGFSGWLLPLLAKTPYQELHVDGFHNPLGILGS